MEVVGKLVVICSCCKIEPSVCFPFSGCSVTVTVTKPGAEAESKARKHDSEAAALEFAKKVRSRSRAHTVSTAKTEVFDHP